MARPTPRRVLEKLIDEGPVPRGAVGVKSEVEAIQKRVLENHALLVHLGYMHAS